MSDEDSKRRRLYYNGVSDLVFKEDADFNLVLVTVILHDASLEYLLSV